MEGINQNKLPEELMKLKVSGINKLQRKLKNETVLPLPKSLPKSLNLEEKEEKLKN